MRKILIATIIALLALPLNIAFAHPGRTDAKGGHTCYTKCEQWGFKQGEYHFHSKVEEPKQATEVKLEAKKKAKRISK